MPLNLQSFCLSLASAGITGTRQRRSLPNGTHAILSLSSADLLGGDRANEHPLPFLEPSLAASLPLLPIPQALQRMPGLCEVQGHFCPPLYNTRFIREQSTTFSGWHRAGIRVARDGSLQVSGEVGRTRTLGYS